jgi:phosphate starvation-inducible PhoH-like protein
MPKTRRQMSRRDRFIEEQSDYDPRFPKSRYGKKTVEEKKNFHIQPKTKNQQTLLDAIEEFAITVTYGPAGTGKTYISAMKAVQLYLKGGYEKIILSRANVPTGRSLGHFPGTVQEKMAPWLMPLTSNLEKGFGKGVYDNLVHNETIEIQPLETIRGRSFEDSIILIDEAQNLNFEEIKAVTTRLGEGSKLILMGDPNQSDVDNGMAIMKFVTMCKRSNIEIPVVEFGVDDIVRSDIVAQLVRMFAAK